MATLRHVSAHPLVNLDEITMVPCREQRPRTERWVSIGIHEAQSLDWGSTGLGIVRYLRDPYNADGTPNVAGIHYAVGTADVAQAANPWVRTVPHILRPSGWSVGIEHVGFTHDDIPTPHEVIVRSASLSGGLIVLWEEAYPGEKFALRHIEGDDIANRATGFFSHYDSTMLAERMGWGTAGAHTDGQDWPWSDYIDAVADDIRVRLGVEIDEEEVQTRIAFLVPGSAPDAQGLQPYVVVDPNDWSVQAWHGAVIRSGDDAVGDQGPGFVNADLAKIAAQEIRAADVDKGAGTITAFGSGGGIYRFTVGV